ncbi:MAG: universal stress protein [Deltaproteobacteria bacterium]|jgi:nucleotide-binding universal stress UspA family protein
MLKKILLATDGSANSRKALSFSVEMATRYDAQLYVLHVIPNMEIPLEVIEYLSAEDIDDSPASFYLEKIGQKIIHQSESECKLTGCDNVHTVVLRGDPADTIVDFAKDEQMDIIVLGSRGFRGIKGRLLGSVSRKVSHAAECSCLIVK